MRDRKLEAELNKRIVLQLFGERNDEMLDSGRSGRAEKTSRRTSDQTTREQGERNLR